MTLYVDTSRIGRHGIGRYAEEVTSRLSVDWTELGGARGQTIRADYLRPERMGLAGSDIIYSPGFNAGMTRAVQVLTIHDLIHLKDASESTRLKRLYYERVIKPACRKAGLVFTVSEASRCDLREWLGPGVEVEIATNGVSAGFTRYSEPESRVSNYLLYVGNTKPHKNFRIVLEALRYAPSMELRVVSSDPNIGREVAAARLGERVSIEAGVDDQRLARLYRESAGLVIPSKYEGFGLPALEARACGTPVAFWSGCAPVAEIVGEYGIAVDSLDDPSQWSAAAKGLERIPRTMPPAIWRERYDWDRTARKVSSRLIDLLRMAER